MSKYTRNLPISIIPLLNKNKSLIYNQYFPNMAIAGHALCVSKAKRTALACAHSEALLSKRKAVGFYKDPVLSADDIMYGLLAFYYLQYEGSQTAIENLMHAFDDFIDSVPEIKASVSERVNVSERERDGEPLAIKKHDGANVSANVSERNSGKSNERKSATSGSATKRKRNSPKEAVARKKKSSSVDNDPNTYFPVHNLKAKQAADYLASLSVAERSKVVEDAFNHTYIYQDYTQGNIADEYKSGARQMRLKRYANNIFMAHDAKERAAFMHKIYRVYVKGE